MKVLHAALLALAGMTAGGLAQAQTPPEPTITPYVVNFSWADGTSTMSCAWMAEYLPGTGQIYLTEVGIPLIYVSWAAQKRREFVGSFGFDSVDGVSFFGNVGPNGKVITEGALLVQSPKLELASPLPTMVVAQYSAVLDTKGKCMLPAAGVKPGSHAAAGAPASSAAFIKQLRGH